MSSAFSVHGSRLLAGATLVLISLGPAVAAEGGSPRLAIELAREQDHAAAAVEFRRLALETEGAAQASYYWLAAHEYWRNGENDRAADVLDRAEDASMSVAREALLLRGEAAWSQKLWPEAAFYHESVTRDDDAGDAREFSARRLAAIHVMDRQFDEARIVLDRLADSDPLAMAAISTYAGGRDKSPRLGGTLGLVPGLGYAYAGEYANALRSLILNGLFIFGMIDTAEDDEWGAFAAITFFEITWYSGSIYGGIDASHRYNRRRLQSCLEAIEGEASFEPEYDALPTLSLKFEF